MHYNEHAISSRIKLSDGSFDTPLKAAQRIPDNIFLWKERKARILDTFGKHALLTNMELAQKLYKQNVIDLYTHALELNKLKNEAVDDPDLFVTSMIRAQDKELQAKANIIRDISRGDVDPNYRIPELNNRTVFHVAAEQNLKDLTNFLSEHGADPLVKDSLGNTPSSILSKLSDGGLVKLRSLD